MLFSLWFCPQGKQKNYFFLFSFRKESAKVTRMSSHFTSKKKKNLNFSLLFFTDFELTSRAIFVLPTSHADYFSIFAAPVVAKTIVSGPADGLATLAVIGRGTGHSIFVCHHRVLGSVLVLYPL